MYKTVHIDFFVVKYRV